MLKKLGRFDSGTIAVCQCLKRVLMTSSNGLLINNNNLGTIYRAEKKSLQILLSSTHAGPGGKVKQEQEEISRNHVPRLFLGSVLFV